ncbi:sterol regulatory element-binding protein cleavage-activating protein-like [Paramacrobiotus metropolitanus]|uniref:sterol regulatory element-binding protein cleavage-activating protein-like n=1 Tax=Paramacrobiotus metropolitanus TaxID=2943436 RepID=UPI002445D59D|nr:sterol regulatory element-binding protein cleavage-activating protein-like [Paramacrobiotus metropolitanus]XP_055352698.1 sterol regulatory element-binding protein cleavage-activating protein-like [Paramacrobiotus metropolitanus]XP_055352699.1 sterol regulatory element-binding protein cleavage-activating protein-like [Paramacrobiotus metropolitanus]
MDWKELYDLYLRNMRVRVEKWAYVHGRFCAGHPYSIIFLSICTLVLCCLPLTKQPLPGYAPIEFVTPIKEFAVRIDGRTSLSDLPEWLGQGRIPEAYVQQIITTAQISHWTNDLIPIDAVRTPLGKVFDILQFLQAFNMTTSGNGQALRDQCYVAGNVAWKYRRYGFLPESECLIISPANIWDLDRTKYDTDSDILGTIFAHEKRTTIDSAPGFKDLAFGVPWSDTGIRPQIFGLRKRSVGFAITVILRVYDPQFLSALSSAIKDFFNVSESTVEPPVDHIVHISFLAFPELVQFLPLIMTYIIVLLYLYFSVRKLEMVKSKIGLAISAVATIFCSLAMSSGLCSFFGLNFTVNGGEIFPYLVVMIGLENVIVITKSVVSTPVHLDVKYRIAQGFSREAWGILKYFLSGLAIASIGYMTYIPAFQEFCMMAFVGLVVDVYLQIFFFCAVLSIDIGRMDLSDHLNHRAGTTASEKSYKEIGFDIPEVRCPVLNWLNRTSGPSGKFVVAATKSESKQMNPVDPQAEIPDVHTARRVRLLWFLLSRRIMQRAFMGFILVWTAVLVYQLGFMDAVQSGRLWVRDLGNYQKVDSVILDNMHKLSYRHWPTLFGYYNVSLSGKYISILPPIRVDISIAPEVAVASRHPLDHKKAPWKDEEFMARQQEYLQGKLAEQDLWVLFILGASTGCMVLGLFMYALRSLWPIHLMFPSRNKDRNAIPSRPFKADVHVYCLLEHPLAITNMIVHEDLVATSCCGGQLRVWNWNALKICRAFKRVITPYTTPRGNALRRISPKDLCIDPKRQIWSLAMRKGIVVAGCADGMIEVYEVETGLCVTSYKTTENGISALGFTGLEVIAGRDNGVVDLIELNRLQLLERYTSRLHLAAVGRVTVVDERVVTVGYDNVIKVMRLPDWICVHSLWVPSGSITSFHLEMFPLGACSGYSDGKVRLWNLESGLLVREYGSKCAEAVKCVGFSDTAVFALYDGGNICSWNRTDAMVVQNVTLGMGRLATFIYRNEYLFLGSVGELAVLDCRTLEVVRTISLEGNVADYIAIPGKILKLPNSDLICDYGRQMRVLRFVDKTR